MLICCCHVNEKSDFGVNLCIYDGEVPCVWRHCNGFGSGAATYLLGPWPMKAYWK
jgi:hypothetical protein